MRRGSLALLFALSACGLPTGDLIVLDADAPELSAASCEDGVFESSPWSGAPWLAYGPRDTLQIEHCLGRTPRAIQPWISFEESGAEAVLASGDLARIVAVDETTITVKNETSAMFFARIVAE
ncbi:MAG TPA: hypothetical protein RMH99_32120 [Sandaracinaceae bacterium LLY-WYZ-13_1]|nr:hypothetical protein [Sandaracinaceae bacterium LLY-WYZ-13_1]